MIVQGNGLVAVAINACKLATQHVHEDEVQDVELAISKLEVLLAELKSDLYQCPICLEQGKPEPGMVRLCWDTEYDDYYPVSSWPYLEGTCEDPKLEPDVAAHYRDHGYRRNHADYINQMMEDRAESSYMSRILGQANQRRQLREVLGVR